jgi:hypothetical protein
MTGFRCPHCRNWNADHEMKWYLGLRVIACPKMGTDKLMIVPSVPPRTSAP